MATLLLTPVATLLLAPLRGVDARLQGYRPTGVPTGQVPLAAALLLAPLIGVDSRPQGHNPALDLAYRLYDDELARLRRRARELVDWYRVHHHTYTRDDWLNWRVPQ